MAFEFDITSPNRPLVKYSFLSIFVTLAFLCSLLVSVLTCACCCRKRKTKTVQTGKAAVPATTKSIRKVEIPEAAESSVITSGSKTSGLSPPLPGKSVESGSASGRLGGSSNMQSLKRTSTRGQSARLLSAQSTKAETLSTRMTGSSMPSLKLTDDHLFLSAKLSKMPQPKLPQSTKTRASTSQKTVEKSAKSTIIANSAKAPPPAVVPRKDKVKPKPKVPTSQRSLADRSRSMNVSQSSFQGGSIGSLGMEGTSLGGTSESTTDFREASDPTSAMSAEVVPRARKEPTEKIIRVISMKTQEDSAMTESGRSI